MVFELKIYDKEGKLKKILKPEEVERLSSKSLLNQKSTVTTKKRIKDYREQKTIIPKKVSFYDKNCVFCRKEFHPRHSQTKYCSHECQKRFYLEKKKQLNK